MEEDASLFTTNPSTPCDFNITKSTQNSITNLQKFSEPQMHKGIYSHSKHKFRNVFGNSSIHYHDFNTGDAFTFTDKHMGFLQWELQNPY